MCWNSVRNQNLAGPGLLVPGIHPFAFTCLTVLYSLSTMLGWKSLKFRGMTPANDSRFATGRLVARLSVVLRETNIPKKVLTGPLFNGRAPIIGSARCACTATHFTISYRYLLDVPPLVQ